MDFTKEQIQKAKNCKTLDDFKALAKQEGLELSEEEASEYFDATRTGELSDDELIAIAGGCKNPPRKFFVGDHVRIIKQDGKFPDLNSGRVDFGRCIKKVWYYDVRKWKWLKTNIPESNLELKERFSDN